MNVWCTSLHSLHLHDKNAGMFPGYGMPCGCHGARNALTVFLLSSCKISCSSSFSFDSFTWNLMRCDDIITKAFRTDRHIPRGDTFHCDIVIKCCDGRSKTGKNDDVADDSIEDSNKFWLLSGWWWWWFQFLLCLSPNCGGCCCCCCIVVMLPDMAIMVETLKYCYGISSPTVSGATMAAWVKFFADFERAIVSCMSLSFSCRTVKRGRRRRRENEH